MTATYLSSAVHAGVLMMQEGGKNLGKGLNPPDAPVPYTMLYDLDVCSIPAQKKKF